MLNSAKAYVGLMMSVVLLCTGTTGSLVAQETPRLKIIIIEGEGATNNMKQRTAREPIVEVQDENNRPVGGALVTFALPNYGASGTFQGGSKLLTITTDANGRAVGNGFQPNTVKGDLNIQVRAQSNGQTANATIHMKNVSGVGVGMSTSAKVWTMVAVAAGAAVIGVVATRGGSPTPPAQSTTISPGTGVVIGR